MGPAGQTAARANSRFLVGEKFMMSSDPGKELKKTLENLTYEN